MSNKISLEKCKYYFNFDENGNLYWKNPNGTKTKIGDVAGSLNSNEYFYVRFEGKNYRLHRILYQLYHDIELNEEIIDHIDMNKQNNSKNNLRICTLSENMHNRKVQKNNLSTGYKNISIKNSKNYNYFYIRIKKDRKLVYSEYFRTDLYTLEQIKEIRDIKLREIHGEIYNLGEIS